APRRWASMGRKPSRDDLRQLLALHDDLARECEARHWHVPHVSADTHSDFLPPHTLSIPAYERLGLLLDVRAALGRCIFETDDEEGRQQVRDSHFVLLRDGAQLTNPAYPIGKTLPRLRPWLLDYCRSEMMKIGTYAIFDQHYTLYARPSLSPSVAEGDWITSRGLRLSGSAATLRQFPHVQLSGPANRKWLPRQPKATVRLEQGDRRHTIPASITFPDESHYVLDFSIPARLLAGEPPVELRVTFDTHFVPKKLGMNDDTRELVVLGPEQIELHRTAGPGMTGKLDQPGPIGNE